MKIERRRYIFIEYIAREPVEEREFLSAFWQTFNRLFGEVNASCVGMFVINNEWEDRRLIIKCSHTQKDNVISAIALMRKVGGEPVGFSTRLASGTLLSLRRKTRQFEKSL